MLAHTETSVHASRHTHTAPIPSHSFIWHQRPSRGFSLPGYNGHDSVVVKGRVYFHPCTDTQNCLFTQELLSEPSVGTAVFPRPPWMGLWESWGSFPRPAPADVQYTQSGCQESVPGPHFCLMVPLCLVAKNKDPGTRLPGLES